MEKISGQDIFETYGKWNALLAKSPTGTVLGIIPAHDGDFFPETPFDYIEALKNIRKDFISNTNTNTIVPPVRVDIDITQICNANCIFCFSRKYQAKEYSKAFVEKKGIDHLLRQLGDLGTRTIRYCGGGECLTHPEIREILPLPHKYGMHLCIITNGDLINEDLVYNICENVDHLRWSVNASSDVTRNKIHRPNPNSNLLSETSKLIKLIVKERSLYPPQKNRPLIGATFLLLPGNIHEIFTAGKMLKDTGVDSISYRPVYQGLGGIWTREMLTYLDKELDQVHLLEDPPAFFVFTPKREINEASKLIPQDHFRNCLSAHLRTVLESTNNGLIMQDCGLYRGTGPKKDTLIQTDGVFENIWRKKQLSSELNNHPNNCQNCIDVSMNKTLNSINEILITDPDANFYLISV
jgi:MoaA/NifB/PqqE/SkfB family radical SAM enzyme